MAKETDAWAPLARQFTRVQYATARGRVRTYVIDAHLRAHLPPPPEVAGRVRLVQASAENVRSELGGERFAGVLCHGVIMYVDDPGPFTAALADLAEPGGVVSLAAFDTVRQVNGLGPDTRADTVEPSAEPAVPPALLGQDACRTKHQEPSGPGRSMRPGGCRALITAVVLLNYH
ncbi:MAG TPA: hypothetical protein VMU94_06430 [Streptosporangiaceae bacterium]|nr:hypothetical protein [Streptosporangiaceae bacterium]